MSESSKMGLFGSKDDNTGGGSNTDESEPTNSKENSSERYNAPYNIDSDSETYDTEALSIMDINDIIGVQAESAGDSTLESEFAALSEVITDCKGEFSSKVAGAPGEDKAIDTCRDGQACDKKPQDSAGMASISKSLQLIGEAYISEDSQETDAEETPESISQKAADINECPEGSKSDAEHAKISQKGSSDETVKSSSEQTAATEETLAARTADLKEDSVQKIAEGPQESTEEAPKSPRTSKPVDSTDSAIVDNSTDKPDEEDKTESMDVDRSPPENIAESAGAESQSKSNIEAEASNKNEVSDEPQVQSAVAETEEPMEVDEASDDISAKVEPARIDSANAEGATTKPEESSESLVAESKISSESDAVRSVEANKCIDETSVDVSTCPPQKDGEESVAPVVRKDESIEVPKVVDEELGSVEVSKNDEGDAEKLEMEIVDEQNEQSIGENVESEKSGTEIFDAQNEKSIGENVESEKSGTEIFDAQTEKSIGENVESEKSGIEIFDAQTEKSIGENVESEKSEMEIVDALSEKSVEKNIGSEKSGSEIIDAQDEKSVEKNVESEKAGTEIVVAQDEKSFEKTVESEKSETEIADAQAERSVEKTVESEESESAIAASIADEPSTVENVKAEASPAKDEEPESPQKVASNVERASSPVGEAAESEPMEVDDNLTNEQPKSQRVEPSAATPDLSANCTDIVESVTDISLKESTSASAAAEPETSEDAAKVSGSVQDESSLQTMSMDEAMDEPAVSAIPEKCSTSSETDELESKPVEKLGENTNDESITSVSGISEKSPATVRVDSRPEVGLMEAENKKSPCASVRVDSRPEVGLTEAAGKKSPATSVRVDSRQEVGSMEAENKTSPSASVRVDSRPEVGSPEAENQKSPAASERADLRPEVGSTEAENNKSAAATVRVDLRPEVGSTEAENKKSAAATVRVDSRPEIGSTEAANKESLATAAQSCEKFQAETTQVDSEVESMEIDNEESLVTTAESCEKSSIETVRVDSTPEVVSKDSAIEESLVTTDELSDKSAHILASSLVEATTDLQKEFTVRAATEFAAEDEKMEVDGGKIEKREEEENGTSTPETALHQAEKSPAIVLPEVGTVEEESTFGTAEKESTFGTAEKESTFGTAEKESIFGTAEKESTFGTAETEVESTASVAVESDVQETVDASSRAASPEVAETENVEASSVIICEKESTESRADDTVDEVSEADKDDDKEDSNLDKCSNVEKYSNEKTDSNAEKDSIAEKDLVAQKDSNAEKVSIAEKDSNAEKNSNAEKDSNAEKASNAEKDSNAEKKSPIVTETAKSTEKSREVEAAEGTDEVVKENEEDESKPEGKEETPEAFIAVEPEKTHAVSTADAKNEETETSEDPPLATEPAVSESISIDETIQDETTAPSEIEEKSVEDPVPKVAAVEAEPKLVSSNPKTSPEADSSSFATTPNDAEEEMNLSLEPEKVESREQAKPVARSLPSEEMATDQDEEIEDRVEKNFSPDEEKPTGSPNFNTDMSAKASLADCVEESSMTSTSKPEESRAEMNMFEEPEEKLSELPRILTADAGKRTVEDCTEESMTSTADKVDEERNDKPCEDIDEYSKDVEPASLSVPEMFHDEQSQTTQEMMESILETDTGNLNKILDAEEAEGEALARSNALPMESEEIDELSDKLPSESDELLNKELDDPMSSQNIDSLEGLLDLDLMPEPDESPLKVVEPIVEKVMTEAEEDIETIGKDVDVSLLLEETEQTDDYAEEVPKVVEEIVAAKEIVEAVDIVAKSVLDENESLLIAPQLGSEGAELIDNDIDAAFALSSVVPDPLEVVPLVSEEAKMDLDEDLLREIAVEEERKMKLAERLFLEGAVRDETKIDLADDLLLETAVQGSSKIDLADEVDADQAIVLADPVLLQSAVEAEKNIVLDDPILLQAVVPEDKIGLAEDMDLESAVQDQVLSDVATEIEDFAPTSEISELESAVKFLQESVEQDIDSPLVLSPKLVESVVEDIAQEADVGIFVADADICDDPSELVAELENIIPDPIAISEAEIISEAAKLESEKKTKEEAKLQSPIVARSPMEIEARIDSPVLKAVEKQRVELCKSPPLPVAEETPEDIPPRPETPKTHGEPREASIPEIPVVEKTEQEPLLKKSAPIPKMSILEERLKVPPKIEIPVGEVSRMCETPTTPKTSLLIQRDAKLASYQKMLESPKSSEKSELKIVDTPRKDPEKHDFENVGSPRIILKIAKSAIADCGEPRSPKSPKIRSATNSPNPEDSPGQKLGKIKLKLSKGGHPSIIPNDNVEEVCGQWHTEGTSSLSPLGMKIKFSKTGDASIVQTEKHEPTEETKEQPKHKFEEAKRTESPIGMKIKLSRTGDPSIVQQDSKESTSKHKDKIEMMQGSPKRTESPIGMKIKLSKSGDASIIQPEKLETSDDCRDGSRSKDKLDVPQDVPRRTESPLGMKIKLFKTGDASIVQSETSEDPPQDLKRTDSPLGMKIKLSKTRGGASIVPADEDAKEKLEMPDVPRRTESPLGMKIKLSKSGDASIIHSEDPKESSKHKDRPEACQDSTAEASGVKIKVTKCGEAAVVQPETVVPGESEVRTSSIGMKIKLSKTGDASIVHSDSQEQLEESRGKERPEKIDSSIGMKIKLSKTGDASIIHNPKKSDESSSAGISETEQKTVDAAQGVKVKLQKSGDGSAETEKKEKYLRRKESELPLEMKIKLSKTGHPTIVACENYGEPSQRPKESAPEASAHGHKHKEPATPKENPGMKMLKSMQSANMHGGRSELTIEPIQLQNRKNENTGEGSPKRKDVTISPIESKKAKLEAKLSQMLPEVTIQPIMPRDPKKMMFDAKASSISRQQMNVISQEISITQVRPTNKPMDLSMTDKLKSMLAKNVNANSDCEIIERHPELIIVNENSNSSQEVMIIEEVPALRGPDAKIPKKRGRPRRNPMPLLLAKPLPQSLMPAEPVLMRDPLALDDVTPPVPELPPQNCPPKENERPKRTCSRQKSYAPPRRGRRRGGGGGGGGRGKRKMEMSMDLLKKPRIDQDLDMIERSTTALITIDETPSQPDMSHNTSELYKALRQPPMDSKMATAMARVEAEQAVNDANLMTKSHMESLMDSRLMSHLGGVMETTMNTSAPVQPFASDRKMSLGSLCGSEGQVEMATDHMDKSELLTGDDKLMDKVADDAKDGKDASSATDHQNWLTPSSKRQLDGRNEGNISNVQVIDEETRMSAESVSRSQTPARNMSAQASETIVNEESQGSVLSTATTESEKVKVKNRRMEINFDPDEGPFTVDKIAEYEWPPDPARKSETFMIQEQISQYLGVKSFKRKYPELKRRMVDMEERNFLRENALVSESMCDMGLTAVSSSEVLDVMCNDFPDQYEEYRKYIREKQMKEHSKKQKELTAAANAERNRIDLAEMAVQSALSWNVGLNKARRESRKCSLDLQTFTIHVPKKQQKVEEESKISHYPVALIPGQYTDYYREYTPAELRYYPLNTVLYGPMKPNERKFDSQSEGSQSDSDSDSSSDDSSSSSSDGTQDTEESQSTMDEVDVELSRQKEDIKSIKCKMCLKHLNKFSRIEVLIQCGTCNGYVHPSCIDLTLDMVPHIQAYAWQCTDCKTCAQCHDPADEDKMLFCDMCDRGYHIYCVGLRRVPQGRWHCQECAVCASCGSREAGGANSDRNSVAQWQHEYKKGDKNTRVYVSTLCVPCSKLWRKGRYCPHCSRCHTVPRLDLEANLVHCSACDKYLHLGCVETKDLTIDRKNYLCDFCQPSRQQMVKPLVSKVFRT